MKRGQGVRAQVEKVVVDALTKDTANAQDQEARIRIQTLAANHGVFRIWTQERSPFWKSYGFQPPSAEVLGRLPAGWKNEFEGGWLTLQLKNEEVITAAFEKQFAGFMAAEKQSIERVTEKVQTFRTVVTVLGFVIGIIGLAISAYLFIHRNPFGH